jgi:AcrR family transcriptional regulator
MSSETTYRKALKEQILTTAIRSFAAQGIKAVKMDDIASNLSISKRTLYEIYANKEILVFECIKSYKQRVEQVFQEKVAACSNVIGIILQFYLLKAEESKKTNPLFYQDMVKYPQIVRFLHQDKQKNHQRFRLFLERGMAEGYFRSDIKCELVVQTFEALGEHMKRQSLYSLYSFDELFFNIYIVMLRGISTPQGIEELDKNLTQLSV